MNPLPSTYPHAPLFIQSTSINFGSLGSSKRTKPIQHCHNTCCVMQQRGGPQGRNSRFHMADNEDFARNSRESVKVGDEVEGIVTRITDYGAFMRLPNGQSGLLHISEIADSFIQSVSNHVTIGQPVNVRIISIDDTGRKISLSIRQSQSARSTGYDRVVELGGDWGHPWNDDGNTQFTQLSSTPQTKRPHHWEPDLSLFKPLDSEEEKQTSDSNPDEKSESGEQS